MEQIDWTAARFFFDLVQVAFMLLVSVYVWWTNKHRATSSALRAVNTRMDKIDRHITQVENRVSSRPGYGEIDKLRSELAETNRGMAQVSAQLQSTTALLNRLHEYMLQEKGNGR
ncbi:DUF2730 family protein [Billgrantia ethanolica]|uniref:DUF2730 family protein n=1 Tax=Billgrantia ethanolica TaxID=2733486 RepID=A0ABS9A6T5_9GAMM|nr:DUF2730 family protein [Halomonas ethanolica]MCE8004237.1 DUF2730 family protein [Halomonas ethanolica]